MATSYLIPTNIAIMLIRKEWAALGKQKAINWDV